MEGKIFSEIRMLVGDMAALQIQQMLQHVVSAQGSFVAKAGGIIAMVLGITGVFTDVQDSINCIWKLKTKPSLDWKKILLKELFPLAFSALLVLCLFYH